MVPKMPVSDEYAEEVASPDTPESTSSLIKTVDELLQSVVMRFASLVLRKTLIPTGNLIAYSASQPRQIAPFFQALHWRARPREQLLFQNPNRLPIQFRFAFCCCKLQAIE